MGFNPEQYHDPVYHAVLDVVGEAVSPVVLGGYEDVPHSGDFDEYQAACYDAEHVAARGR